MTSYIPPKKGAEFIFYSPLVSQSTGQFQVNPTIAAGDFKVSIDGGALNNLATLPAVTPAGSRMVKFTLSTSEMNGDNIIVQGVDAAGSEWDEFTVLIQTSVQQIDDLATQASVNIIDDFLDTEIAAIKTQTDKLTFDSDNYILSDIKAIEGQLTSGNNATLKLKGLDIHDNSIGSVVSIVNDNGRAVVVNGAGGGIFVSAQDDVFVLTATGGNGRGLVIDGDNIGEGIVVQGGALAPGVSIAAGDGDGIYIAGAGTGKSINAPNEIAVSDGDLTLTNIAKKVLTLDWTTITGEAARSALNALRKLRNKVSFNGSTTLTVYKEDGTTSAYTQTVTTDDTQDPFKELG